MGTSCRKAGCASTHGKGKTAPSPSGSRDLPGEPGLAHRHDQPAPTGVSGSSLQYNEYIVYDAKQVRQRFALRVRRACASACATAATRRQGATWRHAD